MSWKTSGAVGDGSTPPWRPADERPRLCQVSPPLCQVRALAAAMSGEGSRGGVCCAQRRRRRVAEPRRGCGRPCVRASCQGADVMCRCVRDSMKGEERAVRGGGGAREASARHERATTVGAEVARGNGARGAREAGSTAVAPCRGYDAQGSGHRVGADHPPTRLDLSRHSALPVRRLRSVPRSAAQCGERASPLCSCMAAMTASAPDPTSEVRLSRTGAS